MPNLDQLLIKINELKESINKINGSRIESYSTSKFGKDKKTDDTLQATWNIAEVLAKIAKDGAVDGNEAVNIGKYMVFSRTADVYPTSLEKGKYLISLVANLDFFNFKSWAFKVQDEKTAELAIAYLSFLNCLQNDPGAQDLLKALDADTKKTLYSDAPKLIKKSLKTFYKSKNTKLADVSPIPDNIKNELLQLLADLDQTDWSAKRSHAKKQRQLADELTPPTTLTPEEEQSISTQTIQDEIKEKGKNRNEFINKALPFLKAIDEAFTTKSSKPLTNIAGTYPDPIQSLHIYLELNEQDQTAKAIIDRVNSFDLTSITTPVNPATVPSTQPDAMIEAQDKFLKKLLAEIELEPEPPVNVDEQQDLLGDAQATSHQDTDHQEAELDEIKFEPAVSSNHPSLINADTVPLTQTIENAQATSHQDIDHQEAERDDLHPEQANLEPDVQMQPLQEGQQHLPEIVPGGQEEHPVVHQAAQAADDERDALKEEAIEALELEEEDTVGVTLSSIQQFIQNRPVYKFMSYAISKLTDPTIVESVLPSTLANDDDLETSMEEAIEEITLKAEPDAASEEIDPEKIKMFENVKHVFQLQNRPAYIMVSSLAAAFAAAPTVYNNYTNKNLIQGKIKAFEAELAVTIETAPPTFNLANTDIPFVKNAIGKYKLQNDYYKAIKQGETEKNDLLLIKQQQVELEKREAIANEYATELDYHLEEIENCVAESKIMQDAIDTQLDKVKKGAIDSQYYTQIQETFTLLSENRDDNLFIIANHLTDTKNAKNKIHSMTEESTPLLFNVKEKIINLTTTMPSSVLSNEIQALNNLIQAAEEEAVNHKKRLSDLSSHEKTLNTLEQAQQKLELKKLNIVFDACELFFTEKKLFSKPTEPTERSILNKENLAQIPNQMNLLFQTLALLKLTQTIKTDLSLYPKEGLNETIFKTNAAHLEQITQFQSQLTTIKNELKGSIKPAFTDEEELYLEQRARLSNLIEKEKIALKSLEPDETPFKSIKDENQFNARKSAVAEAVKLLSAVDEELPLTDDGIRLRERMQKLPHLHTKDTLHSLAELMSRTSMAMKFITRNSKEFKTTYYCKETNQETTVSPYNLDFHETNMIKLLTTGESLKSSQAKWLVTIGIIVIGFAVALLFVAGILALIPTGGTSALAVVAGLVGLHALGLSTLSSAIAAGTTLSVGASATLAAATASVGGAAIIGGVGGLTLFAGRDSKLQKAVKNIQMKPPVLEEEEAKEPEKTTIEKMLSGIYGLFQPKAAEPAEGIPVAEPISENKIK